MDNLKLFFGVALLGFSLILFVISAITYHRIGSRRLLLVSAAFGMFLVKGLLLTLGLFIAGIGDIFSTSVLVTIVDFAIMAFLYLSVVKK
ncbi:MAG: hypothetical protein KKH41_00035 [Candidatus Thermoplasmatota archaeon]|nr:hypothetical protein [Euryarchaeota archaeon]MBU4032535.1 hypothetical protein [Candidatus Thermoplasmatota archaeon]MBU4070625.1 hypothetical protein [Candidatus Thermoplasmatota archaeon]MBU4145034.1 hypothetical protein [Candidatus Thermoplasmatota archaeon]MBU4590953.1 hypothetical protein [Candidatus Thermoplasmatota archaeon]